MVLRLLENTLWVKELNLFIFTHSPNQNSPPGFYRHCFKQKEITHFFKQSFLKIYFAQQRGKDIGHRFWYIPPFATLAFWFLFDCTII